MRTRFSRSRVERSALALAATVLAAAGLGACGDSSDDSSKDDPTPTANTAPAPAPATAAPNVPEGPVAGKAPVPVVAGELTRDLRSPWGVAVLPDGDGLVSSRDNGEILRFGRSTPKALVIGKVPDVVHRSESGLLGIALSPDFASDHFLYAYYTTSSDNRIVRMTYVPGQPLGAPEVVLSGIPSGATHNGGRIAFGPDGMLYAGTGEAGDKELAQDRDSLGGKILRMTPDGKPAPGNPFPDSVVWSMGHRNVQGLAWDSKGRLWAGEFGQNTWDELNLIRSGANYGWPEVEGSGDDPKYVNPIAQWGTDDASPSGIAILNDVVYLAGLKGERLWQAPIQGSTVGEPKAYFQGKYGRLRTVVVAGPGELWLVTNATDGRGSPRKGDDRVLRVMMNGQ